MESFVSKAHPIFAYGSRHYWFFYAFVIVVAMDVLRVGPLIFGKPKKEEKKKE
jgi:hypothetical protein